MRLASLAVWVGVTCVALENRQPAVNVHEALAMTVCGIIAHQSALKDGESLKVPQFDPKT